MVGRLELLTPERERLAEAAVRNLASHDAGTRTAAFEFLRGQGRYVEPIVRRVVATTHDESVKALGKRLLAGDFVTELRAAIHASADGARLADEPVHVRAQLASVLREVGLDVEAKAEGKAVVAALAAKPAPAMSNSDSRQYLRAYIRAMEGLDDARGVAQWSEKFITFGSQVARGQDCRGCHRDAGPRDMAWFRDWWAGPTYARALARAGRLETVIAQHESTLAGHPDDTATRLMLAYLYDFQGRKDKANAAWHHIDPSSALSLNTK
jgi:hypothetical protein